MRHMPDTYRISRQQRLILELLHERQGEQIDYWELRDFVIVKMGLHHVSEDFISSFGRSIRNLLDKSWICAYSHRFGTGRGYYIRMFDIQITGCGISALKIRAVR